MSNRLSDTTEIDGLKFTCHQSEPLELYPMVPRMLEIIAGILPHVSAIGGGLTKEAIEKLFKSGDVKELGPILQSLGAALGKKENANLPKELLGRVTVALPVESDEDEEDDGEPKTRIQSLVSAKEMNAVFRGRFWTMLKVMWWSMGVNFGGFFVGGSETNPSKE